VRPGNEDAVLVTDDVRLVAVADGMGGHQAGEVASATAITALRDGVAQGDSIEDAITRANEAVVGTAARDLSLRGMGTTLTAGVLDGSTLLIGHVGDSRAYLLRAGELRQVTTDHSVIAELIAAGELTEADALVDPRRAMITRALGIDTTVEVDVLEVDLEPGDRLLLCSDGLTTMVRDPAIAEILASEDDRQRAADELVEAANLAGGADNITVVVADVVADDPPVAGDDAAFEDTDGTPAVTAAEDDGPAGDDAALDELRAAVQDEASTPRRRWWQRRKHS
jgi:protein phosphatase